MTSTHPHLLPADSDPDIPFFIRKMDTTGYVKSPEIPASKLPMTGFLFLKAGELLAEASERTFLCYPGQLLIIPEGLPFSIRHYCDCVGYCGGFRTEALGDIRPLAGINEVIHKAFWFDDAAFAGELFNMLELAFEKHDYKFVSKGLDMLLYMAKASDRSKTHPLVSRFLELLFDEKVPIGGGQHYADAIGKSLNWLNRTVRKETGRSISAWTDLARVSRAKKMLQDTDMAIIDIAVAAGMDDQSYFARFFRKHTGMTPTEFRKQRKKLI